MEVSFPAEKRQCARTGENISKWGYVTVFEKTKVLLGESAVYGLPLNVMSPDIYYVVDVTKTTHLQVMSRQSVLGMVLSGNFSIELEGVKFDSVHQQGIIS